MEPARTQPRQGAAPPAVRAAPPDPPGPPGARWFGSLAELRENPMRFYTRIAREYGGVARFFYGRKATYLVSEPDLIKELLVDNRERYVKNRRYKAARLFLGDGLLHSEGETWRRQRRATTPGLSPRMIYRRLPWINTAIAEFLGRWETAAESGEPLDIEPEMSLLSQKLIGGWILGEEEDAAVRRIVQIVGAMHENWPVPPRGLFGHLKPPSPRRIRNLKQALADLDEAVFGAIRRYRERGEEGGGSLLAQLVDFRDPEGRGFDDQEVRDQLNTLYMAGFETSASVLTFLFYRLSLQPDLRQRLYDEVERVLGGRSPEKEDLAALDFTTRSIQEAMRLYPPAYNFTRVALEDDTVGGYRIPAGSMVIVSPFATHRLEKYWPNPEGFDPERFTAESSAGRSKFAFLPFGAGPRICVGANLAMVQMAATVSHIAQRYVLDLVAGHPVDIVHGTVMRTSHGLPVVVRRV